MNASVNAAGLPDFAIEAEGLKKTYAATKTTPEMHALKSIDLKVPRGSIFGLLGALVCYGRRTGQRAMHQQMWTWAVVMFLFGAIMPGVDNWAHAGGFLGGFAVARALDPLKPERTVHMAWALVCLLLTAVSIVLSIVTGAQILRAIEGA